MRGIPSGVAWSLGLCAALALAALAVSLGPRPPSGDRGSAAGADRVFAAAPESCVRYGRVECCYKGD